MAARIPADRPGPDGWVRQMQDGAAWWVPSIKDRDAAELEWWRHFRSRFAPGDEPPPVGAVLLHRMRVQLWTTGGWVTWDEYNHR